MGKKDKTLKRTTIVKCWNELFRKLDEIQENQKEIAKYLTHYQTGIEIIAPKENGKTKNKK